MLLQKKRAKNTGKSWIQSIYVSHLLHRHINIFKAQIYYYKTRFLQYSFIFPKQAKYKLPKSLCCIYLWYLLYARQSNKTPKNRVWKQYSTHREKGISLSLSFSFPMLWLCPQKSSWRSLCVSHRQPQLCVYGSWFLSSTWPTFRVLYCRCRQCSPLRSRSRTVVAALH